MSHATKSGRSAGSTSANRTDVRRVVHPSASLSSTSLAKKVSESPQFGPGVELTPVAHIALDQAGVITWANASAGELLMCRVNGLLGRPFSFWVTSGDRERFEVLVDSSFQTNGVIAADFRVRSGEEVRQVHLAGRCLASAGRLLVALLDVTEQQRMEQTVRQQQTMLSHAGRLVAVGESASAMAHEVNQPLAVILTFSQIGRRMLASGRYSKDTLLDILDKIARQAEYAGDIIRRLRKFVRKEEAKQVVTDLNSVIREAATFVEPEVRANGIAFRLELSDGNRVLADPLQIEQVLVNLFNNAIEALAGASAQSREVVVSTKLLRDEQVVVEVLDNGPGLPPQDVESAFQPFFTTKSEGMGLGLPLSRNIIESHGGRLWYQARPKGGSAFLFQLPCVEGE